MFVFGFYILVGFYSVLLTMEGQVGHVVYSLTTVNISDTQEISIVLYH
jgi:hypothetical protein